MAKKVITDSGQVASDALWQDTSQQPLDAYSFEETLADASQRLAATAVKKKGMIKRLLSTWKKKLTGQAVSPARTSTSTAPKAYNIKPNTHARYSPLKTAASPSRLAGSAQLVARGAAHKVHHQTSPGLKAIQPRSPAGHRPAHGQRLAMSNSIQLPPWMQSRTGGGAGASGSHMSSNRSNLSGGMHSMHGHAGGPNTPGMGGQQHISGDHGSGNSSALGSSSIRQASAAAVGASRPMGQRAGVLAHPRSPGAVAARPRLTPSRQQAAAAGVKPSPQSSARASSVWGSHSGAQQRQQGKQHPSGSSSAAAIQSSGSGSGAAMIRGRAPTRRTEAADQGEHGATGYDSDTSLRGSPRGGVRRQGPQQGQQQQERQRSHSVGRRAADAMKTSFLGCVSPDRPQDYNDDGDPDDPAHAHGLLEMSPEELGRGRPMGRSQYDTPHDGYSDGGQHPRPWRGGMHTGGPGGSDEDMFEEVAISGAYRLKNANSPPMAGQRVGVQYGYRQQPGQHHMQQQVQPASRPATGSRMQQQQHQQRMGPGQVTGAATGTQQHGTRQQQQPPRSTPAAAAATAAGQRGPAAATADTRATATATATVTATPATAAASGGGDEGAEDAISAQLRDLVAELQAETTAVASTRSKHEMRLRLVESLLSMMLSSAASSPGGAYAASTNTFANNHPAGPNTDTTLALSNPAATATAAAAAAGGMLGGAADPALAARLHAERMRLLGEVGVLEARGELLSYALGEWSKVQAVMAGVRVSISQAGALQAILFSDTLARIKAFQKRQAKEAKVRAASTMVLPMGPGESTTHTSTSASASAVNTPAGTMAGALPPAAATAAAAGGEQGLTRGSGQSGLAAGRMVGRQAAAGGGDASVAIPGTGHTGMAGSATSTPHAPGHNAGELVLQLRAQSNITPTATIHTTHASSIPAGATITRAASRTLSAGSSGMGQGPNPNQQVQVQAHGQGLTQERRGPAGCAPTAARPAVQQITDNRHGSMSPGGSQGSDDGDDLYRTMAGFARDMTHDGTETAEEEDDEPSRKHKTSRQRCTITQADGADKDADLALVIFPVGRVPEEPPPPPAVVDSPAVVGTQERPMPRTRAQAMRQPVVVSRVHQLGLVADAAVSSYPAADQVEAASKLQQQASTDPRVSSTAGKTMHPSSASSSSNTSNTSSGNNNNNASGDGHSGASEDSIELQSAFLTTCLSNARMSLDLCGPGMVSGGMAGLPRFGNQPYPSHQSGSQQQYAPYEGVSNGGHGVQGSRAGGATGTPGHAYNAAGMHGVYGSMQGRMAAASMHAGSGAASAAATGTMWSKAPTGRSSQQQPSSHGQHGPAATSQMHRSSHAHPHVHVSDIEHSDLYRSALDVVRSRASNVLSILPTVVENDQGEGLEAAAPVAWHGAMHAPHMQHASSSRDRARDRGRSYNNNTPAQGSQPANQSHGLCTNGGRTAAGSGGTAGGQGGVYGMYGMGGGGPPPALASGSELRTVEEMYAAVLAMQAARH